MPTAIPSNICFVPVVVTGGRKFHGKGFLLSTFVSDVAWCVSVETSRIWDPAAKKVVYASSQFVDDDESVTETDRIDAFNNYVNSIVESTKAWCHNVKPGLDEAEYLKFARNVVRKQHPELRDVIDEFLPPPPDTRDVVKEVTSTVEWALTLRTRPCVIYGRHCEGGKRYSTEKYIDIARKACTKRGLASKPEFEQVFTNACRSAGLI